MKYLKSQFAPNYVRIRHYGLLSTAHREELHKLQLALGVMVQVVKEKKHWKDLCREHLNYNPYICPRCCNGHMVTIEILSGARPPPYLFLNAASFSNLLIESK
ncbi:MAG: hypothetical protein WCK18_10025 [Prolixibacteraceae bacterium]